MFLKKTMVLLTVTSLVAWLGCTIFVPSIALAKLNENYTNGPGSMTGEGDPWDGNDFASGGGGSVGEMDEKAQMDESWDVGSIEFGGFWIQCNQEMGPFDFVLARYSGLFIYETMILKTMVRGK